MERPSITVIVSGPKNEASSIYETAVLKDKYSFAQLVTEPNTKYLVKYNFDLGGETIEIPSGCIIEFDGGSISNGTIIGNDTVEINLSGVNVWGDNLTKEGTWVEQHGGGGEPNVQSDWSQDDSEAPDYIKDKPNLAEVATSGDYNDLINKPTIPTIPINEQVQSDWDQTDQDSPDYIKNKPNVVEEGELEEALEEKLNVIDDLEEIRANAYAGKRASYITDNGIRMEDLSSGLERIIRTALQAYHKPNDGIPSTDFEEEVQENLSLASGAIQSSEKGANGGVATLDANGKIPASQIPGSVDSILEYDSISTAYIGDNWAAFVPNDSYAVGARVKLTYLNQVLGYVCTTASTSSSINANWRAATTFPVSGEGSKIYVARDTNKQYRWSGTQYIEISASLALGTSEGTAYEGSAGKALKDRLDALGNVEKDAQKHKAPTKTEVMKALSTAYARGEDTSATKFLNEQGSWTEISSEKTNIVMDTLDAEDSATTNKNLVFNSKYYIASVANTANENDVVNTLTLPTDGVTKELDIYTFPASANGKKAASLKIKKSSEKQHIICADTGDEASDDFLKINIGDIVHLYYMTSTQEKMTFLMYKYTVISSVENRTKVKKISFDDLYNGFKALNLSVQLPDSGDAYNYLSAMYTLAKNEWDNLDSPLFKAETYPDVSPYHGDNTEYWETTYSALQGWLMAMCLAELIPTKDTTGATDNNIDEMSNNQTKIFDRGYYLGGGKTLPLYGDYAIDADPMIARMAAAAIYAKYHDAKANDIAAARSSITGSPGKPIEASNFVGLGVGILEYEGGSWVEKTITAGHVTDYNTKVTLLGWIPNTHVIVPESPGPWESNHNNIITDSILNITTNRTTPSDQPADLFYTGNETGAEDWWANNYKKDVDIDADICDTYLINKQLTGALWIAKDADINLKTIKSVVMANISESVLFGTKKIGVISFEDSETDHSHCYKFATLPLSDPEDLLVDPREYTVDGPFAFLNLESKMILSLDSNNHNLPVNSSTGNFIKNVRDIADECRVPSMAQYCGRRRPCGGAIDGHTRVENDPNDANSIEEYTSIWNGNNNKSITRIFIDNLGDYNSNENYTNFISHDKAKSYVSGHSAQIATVGLLLAQAVTDMDKKNSSEMAKYLKAIYEGCNLRVIGRYHWNSDTIYGRLFGTMILPIINAMSGLTSSYESAKAVINGGQSSGGSVEVSYNTVYEGGGDISSDNIVISITNNTSSTLMFAVAFDTASGGVGRFDGNEAIAPTETVTKTFAVGSVGIGQTITGARAWDPANSTDASANAFDSTYTYGGGKQYNLVFGGSTASTVTGDSGEGSDTVSTTKLKLVINNNSGSTLTAANQLNFLVTNNNSTVKVGRITLDSAISLTNGQSGTYVGTLSSSSYVNSPFASPEESGYYVVGDDSFASNIILYDGEGYALYNLPLPTLNSTNASQGFKAGATYTVNYGGGGSQPSGTQPSISGGNTNAITSDAEHPYSGTVTGTVTIVNESGSDVTILDHDGNDTHIFIVVSGEDPRPGLQYPYYRLTGSLGSNLSASDLTIPNGGRKTYNLTFPGADEGPEVLLGMNFSTKLQMTAEGVLKYNSNCAYYKGVNAYTFKMMSDSYQFKNLATWVLVIDSTTTGT